MAKFLTAAVAAALLVKRPRDAYKGSVGRVLVVAGSRGLTGAAYLCSVAALKAGAGIVTLAANEGIADIMAAKCVEVMPEPVPEGTLGALGMASLYDVLALAEDSDTVLIGPGLGRRRDTVEFVQTLVERLRGSGKQLVIDADGLFAVGAKMDLLRDLDRPAILTPHFGELERLVRVEGLLRYGARRSDVLYSRSSKEKAKIRYLQRNSLELEAKALAEKWGVVLVAKSERTVIASPYGELFVVTNGNEGMATAGSGDVLAGAIAGIVGEVEGRDPYSAALVGTFLHGHAGDLAADDFGNGLVAGDILAALPLARKYLDFSKAGI